MKFKILDDAIVAVFKTLEATGLKKFLGGAQFVCEDVVRQFLSSAQVDGGIISCTINDSQVTISEEQFVALFQLPATGVISFRNFSPPMIKEMQTRFSVSGLPIPIAEKKKEMKIEYRLLNDVVTKSLLAKAGSFDAYTQERLEIMTAIIMQMPVNWSSVLFNTLLTMIKTPRKQHKGFVVQIGELLRHLKAPVGKSTDLHHLRVLNQATITLYKSKAGVMSEKTDQQSSDQSATPVSKPAALAKRRLIIAEESSESEEAQQPAEVVPSPAIAKKKREKRPRLVKHISEPLRPTLVPAIQFSQLAKGIRLMESDDSIIYGSGLPALDAKSKSKQILVEPAEPLSTVQLGINLTMENVEEMTQLQLQRFDKWCNRRLHGRFYDIKTIKQLQQLSQGEDRILHWVETTSIQEAMKRRDFLVEMLRETFLRKRLPPFLGRPFSGNVEGDLSFSQS